MWGKSMLMRTRLWISLAILAALSVLEMGIAPAHAEWPERQITIVAHFAPGGSNDLLARLIAFELGPVVKQTVIVENRPGANGNIGLASVARANPDGYTLVVASGVVLINPAIRNAGYDPIKDFAPVVYLGASPNVILTSPKSGLESVQDLIAKAKANPGKVTFATPGVGSTSQLAVELLKLRMQLDLVHVPFQGASPAAQAAIAGTTDIASVAVGGMMGLINSGTAKALVQTGKERWPEMPNVPTTTEAGIPDSVVETSQMLLAPAGTPKPIIDKLAKIVLKIMEKPDVREKMLKAGFAVQTEGTDELRARIAREVPMWKQVVERAGIAGK
jgi:tripartite-type tricarboxylate transporter receptor subunit TctC